MTSFAVVAAYLRRHSTPISKGSQDLWCKCRPHERNALFVYRSTVLRFPMHTSAPTHPNRYHRLPAAIISHGVRLYYGLLPQLPRCRRTAVHSWSHRHLRSDPEVVPEVRVSVCPSTPCLVMASAPLRCQCRWDLPQRPASRTILVPEVWAGICQSAGFCCKNCRSSGTTSIRRYRPQILGDRPCAIFTCSHSVISRPR